MVDRVDVEGRLGEIDLFAPLTKRARKKIAEQGHQLEHKPGRDVATQGRGGIGFHLVLGGSAEVDVGGVARRTLGPGDYFGEISLIDGKPRSATVRAGADGLSTFAITAWNFKPLLRENPDIAQALLVTLCARVRTAEALS